MIQGKPLHSAKPRPTIQCKPLHSAKPRPTSNASLCTQQNSARRSEASLCTPQNPARRSDASLCTPQNLTRSSDTSPCTQQADPSTKKMPLFQASQSLNERLPTVCGRTARNHTFGWQKNALPGVCNPSFLAQIRATLLAAITSPPRAAL